MLDFRHTIRRGKVLASWEPGLFALPGVLFMWAALVALHRIALHGFKGDPTLVGISVGILFVAGLCLAGGRWGVAFAPKEKRWGYWIGLFKPFFCFWRSLDPYENVVFEEEDGGGGEKVYGVALSGKGEVSLGATTEEPVAASVAESLAAFLGKALSVREGEKLKTAAEPPFWGQLSAVEKKSVARVRTERGRVNSGPRLRALRGRGPLLLSVFMGAVLYLSWGREELFRTVWGLLAAGLVAFLCLWAVPFVVDSFLRRTSIEAGKKGLSVEERGIWKRRRDFSWVEIRYLAILPPKKGFLELAGRDACVLVGDENASSPLGEALKYEELLGLYSYLLQHLRRYGR